MQARLLRITDPGNAHVCEQGCTLTEVNEARVSDASMAILVRALRAVLCDMLGSASPNQAPVQAGRGAPVIVGAFKSELRRHLSHANAVSSSWCCSE